MRVVLLCALCGLGCGGISGTPDAGDAGTTPDAGPWTCETAPSQPTDIVVVEGLSASNPVPVGPYIYYGVQLSAHPDRPSAIMHRVRRSGSPPEIFGAATEYLGNTIASDGVDLFYSRGVAVVGASGWGTTFPSMLRVSLTQPGATAQELQQTGAWQGEPRTNGNRGVFWMVIQQPDQPDPNNASSVAHWDGTAVTQALANAGFHRSWIADAMNVYWVESSPGDPNLMSEIMAQPLAGGTPTSLAKFPGQRWITAQDDTSLYFNSVSNAPIPKLAKSGGTPVDVTPPIADQVGLGMLVLDGWLYYTDSDFNLWRVRTSGGAMPELFVSTDGNGISWMVGDACGIYWARGSRKLQWKSKQ